MKLKQPTRLVIVRWRPNRGAWECDHKNPPGSTHVRTRRYFESEEAALKYAHEMAPRLDALASAAPLVDQALTLGQAFTRYLEGSTRKKSLREDTWIAKHLLEAFGPTTRLRDITASRIAAYKTTRLKLDGRKKGTALSPGAVNRPLALLRHILRVAHVEWEAIPRVPAIRLEREPQGRLRWLEQDEEHRLLEACAKSQNPHLLAIVTIAINTGLRKGELMNLTWDSIDLTRGVLKLEVTKSGHRREVPMRPVVYGALVGLGGSREGRVWPEGDIRDSWEVAVKVAKLNSPVRFHDLRHTFASWWMMRGGTLVALSRVLGHATLAMTMRYAHLSPEHMRGEMDQTAGPLEPNPGANGLQHAPEPHNLHASV